MTARSQAQGRRPWRREQPLSADEPDAEKFGNTPDEIVFVQGFIWTRTDNGHLIQVDPAMNSMVSAVKIDATTDRYHYCQELGTDGENIWACSAAGDADHRRIDVVRVDPSTQRVTATVEVGKIFYQFDMPFLNNQIWALSGRNGEKLIGIDVRTNRPNPAIELGARCLQLTASGNALYATCLLDNLVIRIDPERREVTAQQSLKSPGVISATNNGVWVFQGKGLTCLDPETLNPVITFTGIGDSGIYATETVVWLWEFGKSVLYKIDPATNEVVELIKPDQAFTSGGGMLATSDSIWLTANEDYLLLRLNLK